MHGSLRQIRRSAGLFSSIVLLLGLLGPATAGASGVGELHAVFILKIVRFVEWPAGSFESDSAPIRVGVMGDDDSFQTVARVLGPNEVNGRRFVLRRIDGPEAASELHIVILADKDKSAERQLAGAFEKLPVLSIGPSFRFAEYGGTIGMEPYQGKIAFDVNHAAARDSGLRISSKVLKLATTVY